MSCSPVLREEQYGYDQSAAPAGCMESRSVENAAKPSSEEAKLRSIVKKRGAGRLLEAGRVGEGLVDKPRGLYGSRVVAPRREWGRWRSALERDKDCQGKKATERPRLQAGVR